MFPNRSKVSDGGIGDARHQKTKSDHNPNSQGVVTARDFTFDNNPADGVGIDCNWLAKVLFENRDPRIKYIIWNYQITKEDKTGWKPYHGTNPHNHHLHLSVSSNPKLYDDDSDWNLGKTQPQAKETAKEVDDRPILKLGSKGPAVATLQGLLEKHGLFKAADIDSVFGPKTQMAVIRFQQANNLDADGVCGPSTWGALNG